MPLVSNRKTRRKPARTVAAGPAAGAPLAPDDIVFGNAAQLRKMAEALTRGNPTARAQATASARARAAAYQDRHPDADLTQLIGRPVCETPAPPAVRPERVPVRVVTNGPGAAELWVDDYIEPPSMWGGGVSARDIREALDDVGSRDVVVHMNSGGGDYFEGVAIYQALAQHPGHVYVSVDALAASAASVVAMAGDTIGIGPGAFIMIHEAASFAYGNADDLLRIADMLDVIGEEIAGFYARRGTTDAATFREAMRAETWYGPAKALEVGLADEELQLPDTDPEPIDTDTDDGGAGDEGEMDPMVSALFDFARPAASTTPTPAPPAPNPPTDTVDPFRTDLQELFT